jgi:hypothetical protein
MKVLLPFEIGSATGAIAPVVRWKLLPGRNKGNCVVSLTFSPHLNGGMVIPPVAVADLVAAVAATVSADFVGSPEIYCCGYPFLVPAIPAPGSESDVVSMKAARYAAALVAIKVKVVVYCHNPLLVFPPFCFRTASGGPGSSSSFRLVL